MVTPCHTHSAATKSMAWKKKDRFLDGSSDDDDDDSTSTARAKPKKRRPEKVNRWGSAEDRRFNELVADGTIKLRKNESLKTIDKIGEKYFAGRSTRSFRDHYRGIVSKLRLEKKLAGGRRRIAGKTDQSYYFFGGEILTSSSLLSPLTRTEGLDPEDTTDDTDTDDDIISSDIMPPTNLKKRPTAAAAMTSTGKKKKAASFDTPSFLPFSPVQVSTYQHVSYSEDGGSWIEVSVFAGGFVKKGEFKFELARDGTTLAFSQVIPTTFFRKTPPDHELMSKNELKVRKNNSRTVNYATVVKNLRSTLDYDSTNPHFAEAQIFTLERQCESIVDFRAIALPTKHTVNGSQQYATTMWCKLRVAEQQQKKNRGSETIIVEKGSMDDDSSDDDSDDSEEDSSSSDDDVPMNGHGDGGGGGSGGGGKGKKRKSGGRGGKKGGERKKSSSSSRKHNNIKAEASMKSEPAARRGGGIVSLLSQPSD